MIEEIIAERGITRLVHFTRLANVTSILKHGLVPRAMIADIAPQGQTNDPLRLDGREQYNCLSITFPNSRMFYAYMMENPDVDWAVLLLKPALLVEGRVLFCRHNAADNRVTALADEQLKGAAAFQAMFDEIDGLEARADQYLKPADPTDVQAEVLVRGLIERAHLDGIVFQTPAAAQQFNGVGLTRYVSDRRGLFGDRNFYRTWGKGK
ncbi:MAG: DUF4433 domain-containing protein [Sphingomonas sp.]|nr:DUF4433 domain-containing protein [Sphingomonas sp.]